MMSLGFVLRLAAVVCFGLATAGVSARVNLVALGLACWSASTVVG